MDDFPHHNEHDSQIADDQEYIRTAILIDLKNRYERSLHSLSTVQLAERLRQLEGDSNQYSQRDFHEEDPKKRLFFKILRIIFLLVTVIVILFFCFSVIFFYTTRVAAIQAQNVSKGSQENSQTVILPTSKERLGIPVRIKIASINVHTEIERVNVTSNGDMETPNNAINVGWFQLGPRPGEKGNAVIAGHYTGENGEAGVFHELSHVKVGDVLSVDDSNGNSIFFTVREIRLYDPGFADDVFRESDGIHLNLITCDGVWDGEKNSYDKRLVVFTDLVE